MTVVAFGTLLAACAPGAGPAADWSRDARISGTVRADTNPDLDPTARTLVTNSVETGLTVAAKTKRGLFSANLGIVSSYFLGEDKELAGTGRIDPQLTAEAAYRGKTDTLTGRASVSTRSTSFSRLEALNPAEVVGQPQDVFATVDQNATEIAASVGAGLAHRLDPRNQLTVDLSADVTRFTQDVAGLVPTRTVGATAGWQHDVSETGTTTLSAGLRDFNADNGTRSQTLDLQAGVTYRRTPRHTFTLDAGISAVRSTDDVAGGSPTFDVAFTGDAGLDYRLKRLSATLSLSQDVEPSTTEGALQAFTRAFGSLGYRITPYESLGATLGYTRRAPLSGSGDTDQLLTLGPTYSIELGPDTELSFGYAFRLRRNDTEGTVDGHEVFVTLGHDLSF